MTLRIRAYYSNIQTRCWLHWLTAGKLKEKQSQQVDKHRSRLEFLSVYEEDRVGGKNKGTSLSTKILLPSLPLSWIDKDCLFSSCLPLSLQPDNPFFVLSFPELLCYLCHWVCNNNNNSCPFFQSLREEVILRNGFTLRTPIKILTQEIKYFGTTCLTCHPSGETHKPKKLDLSPRQVMTSVVQSLAVSFPSCLLKCKVNIETTWMTTHVSGEIFCK